jgi:uncharacterized protein (DUF2236 family)
MTIAERINAERVVLAGWSRAILLQLAHPLVAQGVADHSTFREGLFTAAVRLHQTVGAMRRLTFGTAPEARRTLDGILAIHARVNGTLRDTVGPFPAGTRYSAEDPALLLWVHATLLDSLPLVYEALVVPLTPADRDAWCRESAPVARALGAAADVPETWAALQTYMTCMYASGQIVVGETARRLAQDVLSPRLSLAIAPVRTVNRQVTVGLLPPPIRDAYGFVWDAGRDARLERTLHLLRTLRRLTPEWLAYWPDARHARLDVSRR